MQQTKDYCKLFGCKKRGTEICNQNCYPFIITHGQDFEGGFWGINNVPHRYKDATVDVLHWMQLPQEYKTQLRKYFNKITDIIDNQRVGIYFFSKASGTGKTTLAVAMMHEYLINRIEGYLKELQSNPNIKPMKESPVYFIGASEFQNIYNAQFRTSDNVASDRYYTIKNRMKNTDLLVIDDIAIRDLTDAFHNELFEVIDYRTSRGKPMILTSNEPLETLEAKLGQRIVSRIKGSCFPIPLLGGDNRKVEIRL